jgi:hypothetical protein
MTSMTISPMVEKWGDEKKEKKHAVSVFSGVHQQISAGACILLVHFLPQNLHQQNLRCTIKISNPIFDISYRNT